MNGAPRMAPMLTSWPCPSPLLASTAIIGMRVSGSAVPTAAKMLPTTPSFTPSLRPNHSTALVKSSALARMSASATNKKSRSSPRMSGSTSFAVLRPAQPHPMEPVCESQGHDGNQGDDRPLGVGHDWPESLFEERILKDHLRTGPGDNRRTGVSQPPEAIDNVRQRSAHEHQDRHADDQPKDQEARIAMTSGRHPEYVVGAHHQVSHQDRHDGFAEGVGYLHSFVTFLFLLQQVNGDPE